MWSFSFGSHNINQVHVYLNAQQPYMKLSIFALIAPLCVYGHRGCGTPEFTPQELARNEMEFKAIVKTLPDSLDEFSTVIDVYFHEIRAEETSPLIDTLRITKQIDFMNNAFSNSGISFKHISTDSVVNIMVAC
jgi:hypothetical protein